MPRGPTFRRPNYRRRRTFAALGLLAVVAVVVALLTRGGRESERPIPELSFVAQARHVAQGRAAPAGVREGEVAALTRLFSDYYQRAFVDPRAWGDGTFADLAGLFAEDARASFQRDLASLTIGDAREELARVDLGPRSLGLTIYYDAKRAPTFAVASVRFEGIGTLKEAGPRLRIVQTATYYLQKVGEDWRITAYDADQSQTTQTPSPSPSS